jgi:hypothetical protein
LQPRDVDAAEKFLFFNHTTLPDPRQLIGSTRA